MKAIDASPFYRLVNWTGKKIVLVILYIIRMFFSSAIIFWLPIWTFIITIPFRVIPHHKKLIKL